MAPIFREEGVPHEFLIVGLIESGYQTGAVSPREAVGMWQFIPSTARRFGLLDDSGDHRTDFERSTRAAARYLRFLLDRFSDWRLALAAYNAGEDRVERAIELGRTRDFEKLSGMRLLPEETRNYVPSVLRAIAQARNLGGSAEIAKILLESHPGRTLQLTILREGTLHNMDVPLMEMHQRWQ